MLALAGAVRAFFPSRAFTFTAFLSIIACCALFSTTARASWSLAVLLIVGLLTVARGGAGRAPGSHDLPVAFPKEVRHPSVGNQHGDGMKQPFL